MEAFFHREPGARPEIARPGTRTRSVFYPGPYSSHSVIAYEENAPAADNGK